MERAVMIDKAVERIQKKYIALEVDDVHMFTEGYKMAYNDMLDVIKGLGHDISSDSHSDIIDKVTV